MSKPRAFKLTPPDMRFPALVIGATVLICAGSLALAGPGLRGPLAWLVLGLVLLAPASLLVAIFRRQVLLDDADLRIIAGLNQTRVARADLHIAQARIVNLDEHPENRIGIKIFGTAMPGYHAGHFRQIGGQRVFALVTDKRRVLVLPERSGRLLMLSLAKPQALLDALQDTGG